MNEQGRKSKVFLVDDHPIVRHGLTQLINQHENLVVCGEAGDSGEALEGIAASKPDIAIVDLTLKSSSGMELIDNLKIRFPDLLILVLSMHEESVYAERALRAGARGYIMKEKLTDNVIHAILQILNGKIYVSEEMAERMLDALVDASSRKESSPLERLSDRELQVFELTGQGLTTSEIAEKLHTSRKTVHSYRTRIKEKLRLEKTSDLLKIAFRWSDRGKTD